MSEQNAFFAQEWRRPVKIRLYWFDYWSDFDSGID